VPLFETIAVLILIAVIAAWLLPAPVGAAIAVIAIVAALLFALRAARGRRVQ
jgi:Flp pilus assembly protein TadB